VPQKTKSANDGQSAKFVEAARELGCEDSTAASDALLGRLAKMPPQPQAKRPKARAAKPATAEPKE
jgi:hypothetical protein